MFRMTILTLAITLTASPCLVPAQTPGKKSVNVELDSAFTAAEKPKVQRLMERSAEELAYWAMERNKEVEALSKKVKSQADRWPEYGAERSPAAAAAAAQADWKTQVVNDAEIVSRIQAAGLAGDIYDPNSDTTHTIEEYEQAAHDLRFAIAAETKFYEMIIKGATGAYTFVAKKSSSPSFTVAVQSGKAIGIKVGPGTSYPKGRDPRDAKHIARNAGELMLEYLQKGENEEG